MKLNPEYVLRNIAGEQVVVPTGQASRRINGLITLNATAVFLWECAEKGMSRQEMIEKTLEEFDVDEATAVRDVNGFSDMLLREGFATEETPDSPST